MFDIVWKRLLYFNLAITNEDFTMTKRTDIHRPSAINPVDYQFIAAFTHDSDMWSGIENAFQRKLFIEHRERTGGKFSQHDHGGSCHICGAHALNLAVFYHHVSNSYIETGFDCADKLDGGDPALFRKIKDERTAYLKARAGKMKALGTLEERGLLEQVDILFGDFLKPRADHAKFKLPELPSWLEKRAWRDMEIAGDILRKLVQYGDLSEKQWKFFEVLLTRILTVEEKAKEIAERQATELRIPAPDQGRVTVQGVIISKKEVETDFGIFDKIAVKDPRGFVTWGTLPKGIDDAEVGDTVRFDARLTRSEKDESFAFASRPSKASIVQKKEG